VLPTRCGTPHVRNTGGRGVTLHVAPDVHCTLTERDARGRTARVANAATVHSPRCYGTDGSAVCLPQRYAGHCSSLQDDVSRNPLASSKLGWDAPDPGSLLL